MDIQSLTLELASAFGISGAESAAADLAERYLAPLGACSRTPLGGVVCTVRPPQPGQPHLLLTAHLDEVGFVVTQVDDKGFIRFAPCGGSDRSAVWAAPVCVHTQSGPLDGVVCTIPPHLSTADDKLPKFDELSIDVGLPADTARLRIQPGDRISLGFEATPLAGSRICCKALDDRAGCAAVLEAARLLANQPAPFGLSVLLAPLEEVGGQGARTGAAALSPTHALVVDVSFGMMPGLPREKCGELGKGPMLGIAPILDHGMITQLRALAARMNLPIQLEVMGGATGTDADVVAIAGAGVRTGMLSIPLLYMHAPIETVDTHDIEATARLIAAWATEELGGVGHAV